MPQMPSMPSISTPSLNTNANTQRNETNSNDNDKTQESSINAASLLNMNSSNPMSSLSDLESIISSISQDENGKTNLSSITSILSNSDITTETSFSVNTLLTQILQKLEELQNQLDTIKETPKENFTSNETITKNNSLEKKETKGKILRFRINNHDLSSSFTTLFYSDKEKDGSFLLTGDRVYNLYGKQMNETFYMLFKNTEGNNFDVAIALTQFDKNSNSFLYKLSKDSPYKSKCTGNLYFIASDKNNLKIDILIEY